HPHLHRARRSTMARSDFLPPDNAARDSALAEEPPAQRPTPISARLANPFAPFSSPMSLPSLKTRTRLSEVRYEIRGELARRARELEAQGRSLIKLNIGNPGAFGFRAPEHLQRAIADHIAGTDPYTHQQGLPEAR